MNTLLGSNKKKIIILLMIVSAGVAGCKFYFQKTTDRFTVDKKSNSLKNGKNLAENVCAGCHYDQRTKRYSGFAFDDLPRAGGKLFTANLTHSKKYGAIENYSDAELFYLIKTGISRSGKFMPYMMRPTIADADLNDLIVYFRSDDAPLRAFDSTAGKTHINLIGRMGIRAMSKPSPYIKGVPRPDENNPVAYGRYLVGVIGCYHCHSKKFGDINYTEPEKTKGYLAGGMKMKDYSGERVYAANITPDKSTGIGAFTADDFSKAVRTGVGLEDMKVSPPMPVFAHMTRKQSDAIFAYIKQLPPINHKVND